MNCKLCPPHKEGQDRQDKGEKGDLLRGGWWQMVGGDAASHCFQLYRNEVQYSVVQYREVQCSAVQFSTVQCKVLQCSDC